MGGTRLYPMHQCPFDLVQIQRLDETCQPCGPDLWLWVGGKQRHLLSLGEVQYAYRQRFNLEHFLGFAKPHLWLTASQTCDIAHEINWVRLACLAHVQLWAARRLVDSLPLPWQRYWPQAQTRQFTPRRVQRGFARLIQQTGTLAVPPKTRGISPGRRPGTCLSARSPCPIVKFHPHASDVAARMLKTPRNPSFLLLQSCDFIAGANLFVQNQVGKLARIDGFTRGGVVRLNIVELVQKYLNCAEPR